MNCLYWKLILIANKTTVTSNILLTLIISAFLLTNVSQLIMLVDEFTKNLCISFKPPTNQQSASNKPLIELAENENPWHVWLEFALPDATTNQLPSFDKQGDILLFLKMFNPRTQTISYCGHLTIPIDGPTVSWFVLILVHKNSLRAVKTFCLNIRNK